MEGLTGYGTLVAAILILAKVLRDEQLRRYEKKNNKNGNPGGAAARAAVLKTEVGAIKTGQVLCQAQLKELCEASIKANVYLEQILDEVKNLKP